MSVKLNVREIGDVTILEVEGRITFGEGSSTLRDAIRTLQKNNKNPDGLKLVLDLSKVSNIDTTGIGQLVSEHTNAVKSGSQLKILTTNSYVRDVLKAGKLDTVFEFCDNEADAVRSFYRPLPGSVQAPLITPPPPGLT